jgi:hypothetical protein
MEGYSGSDPSHSPLLKGHALLRGHARTMLGMWAWFTGLLPTIDEIRVSNPTVF